MENTKSISFPYDSIEEYEERQKDLIREAIKESLPQIEKKHGQEALLTRKQVAEKLHISLPTLNSLTKDGTLSGYRLSGRVLYKEVDVLASLRKIEPTKYKRAQ